MLHLKSIEYKNVNSVGNTPIKIFLNRWDTTLIGGKNGTGKSTALMAIVYALYGKFINGMKLEQAINSQNKKNLLTTIEFEKNGDDFTVIRGEKPKRFEIFKNGEQLPKNVKSGDYQTSLELVLGMDYKTFVQLVGINKVRYKPFFEMPSGERRKLVEDVLNISVFSYMNEEVKSDLSDIDKQIRNLEHERDLLKEKQNGVSNLVKQLETSLKSSTKELEEDVVKIQQDILFVDKSIIELESQIDESVWDKLDTSQKMMAEYKRQAESFERDLKLIDKDMSFYTDHDECPTCHQSITDDIKNHKCNTLNESKESINKEFLILMNEYESASKELDELTATATHMQTLNENLKRACFKKTNLETQVVDLQKKIERLQTSDDQVALESNLEKYAQIDNQLDDMFNQLTVLHSVSGLYTTMKDLLKDDGVKSNIIRDYNGILNRTLNEYLNAMGFYINMTLDENFSETFHSMNKESFSYENLSTGQATRLNIAFMLSLLEIGAIKNSASCNLLWLDETLENLDDEGVDDAVRLLKTKLKGKNIFVATQRFDEFVSKFQSSITFRLNEGFTEIVK